MKWIKFTSPDDMPSCDNDTTAFIAYRDTFIRRRPSEYRYMEMWYYGHLEQWVVWGLNIHEHLDDFMKSQDKINFHYMIIEPPCKED